MLHAAEGAVFEMLMITDKNMRYQQNITGRRISVVILQEQQWPDVRPHVGRVVEALNSAAPGSYTRVHMPCLAGERQAKTSRLGESLVSLPGPRLELVRGSKSRRPAGRQCYPRTVMDICRRQWLLLVLAASRAFPQNAGKRVILLLGPPGAGKTTQARRLKSTLRIPAFSVAEILRKEGGGRSGLNKALKAQIAGGELVNDEVTNALVRKRVEAKESAQGFILDGYPGTAKQADYFDQMRADLGLPAPVVIHISIPDSVADTRLGERGRADDSPANTERRIVGYREQATLILSRYGSSVKTVDGTKTPDEVAAAIRSALGL